MTKRDLIEKLAVRHRKTRKDVGALLESAFETIWRSVAASDRFAWPGFGIFYLKSRKARRIRNPVTGGLMRLPRSKGIGFRAAKEVKAQL